MISALVQPTTTTPPSTTPWHVQTGDAALAALGGDREGGLAPEDAADRLVRHGRNEIREVAPRTPLAIFAGQFTDFMIVVLLAAAAVSGAAGEPRDALAILVIVVLNGIVGAVQEYRADRAIAALRRMSDPTTLALRGGQWVTVAAAEVVPGDVLKLRAGDVVPADIRLLDAIRLAVDESPLTGESQTVDKVTAPLEAVDLPLAERVNMVHCGTLVTGGTAVGAVVATGMDTELGRIAELLRGAKVVQTPLQVRLARLGRTLALVVLAVCALIFGFGLLRGEAPLLMFLTAVSLAVAAIPEALPAVVTVSLALGARKMVRRNALVRRLAAVETLGSVTYICSDKTGTLTRNRMRVEAVLADGERRDALPPDTPPAGSRTEDPWTLLGRAMALNNDAVTDPEAEGGFVGDPTEVALRTAAAAAGHDPVALTAACPRVAEVPFDAGRRRMSTLHRAGDAVLAFVKGAPESVVPLCDEVLTSSGPARLEADRLLAEAEVLAADGYRVLAFAVRRWAADGPTPADDPPPRADEVEAGLQLLGLAAMVDPPRDEAPAAIETARAAGITPVMITGDHPGTAQAIARRLGMAADDTPVLTGRDLSRLSADELADQAASVRIYARVSPEQKIDIVRALQQRGEFVAMTGDGVNDAPALKRAEIGVAMGLKGTDVAKEAADMVLMDDDFATIVSAVREGRRVFDNIRKFVKYTLTSNSGEIWTLFLAPLVGLPLPLLPIQILWINLVTDGLPGLALAVEPEERGLMRRPPRPPDESMFAHGMGLHIAGIGLLIGLLSLGVQWWSLQADSLHWRSMVFTTLTFSQLAHALVIRSERESLFTQGLMSNPHLLGAVLLTVALQLAVLYLEPLGAIFSTTPLPPAELLVCTVLPLTVVVAVELEKLARRRREAAALSPR